MKAELTCAIVRDLLPSYVDGLTSQETNEALKKVLLRFTKDFNQKMAK